jgi:hypothetical protein
MMIVKDTKPDSTDSGDLFCWLMLAIVAVWVVFVVTVQWLIACARLDDMNARLSSMAIDTRAKNSVYADMQRRIGFIEGVGFRAGSSDWDVEAKPE